MAYATSAYISLIYLRYGTPDRSTHYLQKSSDFYCDFLLLYRESGKLWLWLGLIMGLSFAQKAAILGFNFNIISAVVCV